MASSLRVFRLSDIAGEVRLPPGLKRADMRCWPGQVPRLALRILVRLTSFRHGVKFTHVNMKNPISLVVTFCLASNVAAHYVFNKVDLAGVTGAEFEGIRPNTNGNSPVTGNYQPPLASGRFDALTEACSDLASTGLRCNEGGLDGSATTVREVQAGDEFTFHSDIVGCPPWPDIPVAFRLLTSIPVGRVSPRAYLDLSLKGPRLCARIRG